MLFYNFENSKYENATLLTGFSFPDMTMNLFEDAISWHEHGCLTSPKAASVAHTRAILAELNEALGLLRKIRYDCASGEVLDFVARHHRGPAAGRRRTA